MITTTDVHVFPLTPLECLALQGALETALTTYGTRAAVAKRLNWDPTRLDEFLACDVVRSLPGDAVLDLELADIEGRSLMRVIHQIEEACVEALLYRGNNHLIADILGTGEWHVRRISERIRRKRGG